MPTVIVTGAGGFIGRTCVASLGSSGLRVIPFWRRTEPAKASMSIQVDLLNATEVDAAIEASEATHLLHLAWYAAPGRFWSSPENLEWVRQTISLVMAFARHGGKRIILAGTCAEYDWRYGYCSEATTPLNPATVYGASKLATYLAIKEFCAQNGVELAWARIFWPYGPGEDALKFMKSIAHSLLRNQPARCYSGDLVRDYIYVDDVGRALAALVSSEYVGAINVGSGIPVTLRYLAEQVAGMCGGRDLLTVTHETREASPLVVADMQRFRAQFPTFKWTAIEEGVLRLVQSCEDDLKQERQL